MNRQTIHVGVIGTGGMGARHTHNLAHRIAQAQVVAVMDVDRERAQAVAADCGEARAFMDANELIACSDVAAVVIASPDPTHAELTLACLEAGKPVLCEKPLATRLADAERVLRAEAALGRRLVQVGLMREFDPAHIRLKRVVASGALGRPLLFRGVHANAEIRPVRSIDEVIVNSAIHDIHSTRWIMGQEVVSVFVQYVQTLPDRPESCRLLSVQMQLEGGALAVLEVNSDSGYGYEVDVEVSGEKGSVRTDSLRSPIVRTMGARSQTIESDWLQRFEEAYFAELQAWIHSLIAAKPIGPSVWDGTMALAVADACMRSARTAQPELVQKIECPDLYRV